VVTKKKRKEEKKVGGGDQRRKGESGEGCEVRLGSAAAGEGKTELQRNEVSTVTISLPYLGRGWGRGGILSFIKFTTVCI
jgi:hypothetical protein